MNRIPIYPKAMRRLLPALGVLCCMLASCDKSIYDYEGDCDPHYEVKFLYDYNMKFADAFAHEVHSVTLHLVDDEGRVVWRRTESGKPLGTGDYTMDVDVAPGRYTLQAWAGDEEQRSFEIDAQAERCEELTARLRRERTATGGAYSAAPLSQLYNGFLADVEFPEGEGRHRTELSLTKNTNYVKVVLQQVGGTPLAAKDLEVSIVDDNGMMEWNNLLRPEETITYRPWNVTPISANISPDDESGSVQTTGTRTGTEYTGVMAEFTTSRLVESHRKTARLVVRNLAADKDKTIFSVKLIDFLLMVKGEYNRRMTDQEYLDRQDAFDLVFFLDEGHKWASTTIFINSWRVVLDDINFE